MASDITVEILKDIRDEMRGMRAEQVQTEPAAGCRRDDAAGPGRAAALRGPLHASDLRARRPARTPRQQPRSARGKARVEVASDRRHSRYGDGRRTGNRVCAMVSAGTPKCSASRRRMTTLRRPSGPAVRSTLSAWPALPRGPRRQRLPHRLRGRRRSSASTARQPPRPPPPPPPWRAAPARRAPACPARAGSRGTRRPARAARRASPGAPRCRAAPAGRRAPRICAPARSRPQKGNRSRNEPYVEPWEGSTPPAMGSGGAKPALRPTRVTIAGSSNVDARSPDRRRRSDDCPPRATPRRAAPAKTAPRQERRGPDREPRPPTSAADGKPAPASPRTPNRPRAPRPAAARRRQAAGRLLRQRRVRAHAGRRGGGVPLRAPAGRRRVFPRQTPKSGAYLRRARVGLRGWLGGSFYFDVSADFAPPPADALANPDAVAASVLARDRQLRRLRALRRSLHRPGGAVQRAVHAREPHLGRLHRLHRAFDGRARAGRAAQQRNRRHGARAAGRRSSTTRPACSTARAPSFATPTTSPTRSAASC